jgi:hypothetical protein
VADSNLRFVSVKDKYRTRCGVETQKQACNLRDGRWEEYQQKLEEVGILSIEREESPTRYYFTIYYQSFLMDARLRGVVYSEANEPHISSYHPKQQWWPIKDGWYSYQMIDS